jgi:nicotinamidase-related amidase
MKPLNIDKNKTAIVVIDLQKGTNGRFTAPYESDVIVKNAVALTETCRKNKMPVFLVRVKPSSDGKDFLQPVTDSEVWSIKSLPEDFAEIIPELGPKPEDFVITKKQWGAFYGTELDLQLRRRKIDTIILCGIATNIGVESTARFAYEYGYNQIFAEDAMSAMAEDEHEHTVKKIFPRMGQVRTTKEILAVM